MWLLCFLSLIIIPQMVAPFDFQQLMQTPLIKSISLPNNSKIALILHNVNFWSIQILVIMATGVARGKF